MQKDPKIKVLYLITKSNWGGAQTYVYTLAKGVKALGYSVVVAAGGTGEMRAKQGKLKEMLTGENIATILIPNLARDIHFFHEWLVLWSLCKLYIKERPDVVHLNSSKIGGIGAVAGFLTRTKTIYTVHGLPYEEDRGFIMRTYLKFLTWLSFMFTNKIITMTKSDFDKVNEMPLIGHKASLIHNAIEQIDFYTREEARNKLGLPQDEHVIGTISELTANKGLEFLAEVASTMPEINFVVIGSGELKEKLSGTNLKLLGFIPEANRYMKAFGIFTLTSTKEGLPYTLLEAGQAGLPVVASNIGGIPDIIGIAGLLVEPKNPKLIAEAIKILISNPELRAKLGSDLKARVEKEFNFDKFLSETYKLYN